MMMMGLVMILPLLLIGAIVFALSSRLQTNQTGRAQTSQTPVDILKARYAGGEITREAYEQMRRDLGG